MKKYIVELTSEERSGLKDIIKAERMAAHKRRHARILLDASWKDGKLAGVVVKSDSGNLLRVRNGDRVVQYPTNAGETYRLDGNLSRYLPIQRKHSVNP